MNQKQAFTFFGSEEQCEEETQTDINQELTNQENKQFPTKKANMIAQDETNSSATQQQQKPTLFVEHNPEQTNENTKDLPPTNEIPNISYPAPPPPLISRKKPVNLFLPVKIIELAEKETAFPTDGNSQKKKQNVFSFYDNFHEYTVFCDVAMKKCSRNYQEDRFSAINPLDQKNDNDAFFAVFDGHGTSVIADILKEHLHTYICQNEYYCSDIHRAIKESFQKIDDEIVMKQKDNLMVSGGSTALCCLIKEDQLYIINCGDSSSVLVSNEYNVEVLNNLHKPCQKEEAAWLQQKNTLFTKQRVFGTLATTRAFGDYKLKDYIISEPEIKVFQIDDNSKYCLLGTDGFWDVKKKIQKNQQHIGILNSFVKNCYFPFDKECWFIFQIIDYKKDLPDLLKAFNQQFIGLERSSLKDLSTYLVEIASKKTTQSKKDNMTLLAIDLNWFYRKHTEAKDDKQEERQLSSNGSSIIVCSQTQLQAENSISSFLFQAKSPLSVFKILDKKSSLVSSLNSSKNNEQKSHEGPQTCGKQKNSHKAFFSFDHSDDDKPPVISQATSVLFTPITDSTIQIEENKQTDEIKLKQDNNNKMFIFSNDGEDNPMAISQTISHHTLITSNLQSHDGQVSQVNQLNDSNKDASEQPEVAHKEKQNERKIFQF